MSQTHKHMVWVSELPEPEADYNPKWDERFQGRAEVSCENVDWPKLSIVTPSFNQGRFIERTIRCILLQNYPNLEYIVIDGGSTDESLKIIEKYQAWISYWLSEPDAGMYDALNKGFAQSTGEIMAWSPTGDLYEPGALRIIGQVFRQKSDVKWLTSLFKIKCDEDGRELARYRVKGFNRRAFERGLHTPRGRGATRYAIQQQSTFWRRNLWQRCGVSMDASMKGAGDFELWSRFFLQSELYSLDWPIGVFMTHEGQESVANSGRMAREQEEALKRMGGEPMGKIEDWIHTRLFSKRPLRAFRPIRNFGFTTNLIEWNSATSKAAVKSTCFF